MQNSRLSSGEKGGIIDVGGIAVDLGESAAVMRTSLGEASPTISIGLDVTSLVFLHACEKPAFNGKAYHYVFNFDDTADLLGYYQVTYVDGFITTIPVRYGVNILERTWPVNGTPQVYCYQAAPIAYGNESVFFAFEWLNPRLGKAIKSISFHGSSGFRSANGKLLKDNAILLKALSAVRARPTAGSDERKRVLD